MQRNQSLSPPELKIQMGWLFLLIQTHTVQLTTLTEIVRLKLVWLLTVHITMCI